MLLAHSIDSKLFDDDDQECIWELEKLRKKQKIVYENCGKIFKYAPLWIGESSSHDSFKEVTSNRVPYGHA
jgi:hypothetical protein